MDAESRLEVDFNDYFNDLYCFSITALFCILQMDSAVEEVFLNVTPLHRAEHYIQSELNKLQSSVRVTKSIKTLIRFNPEGITSNITV